MVLRGIQNQRRGPARCRLLTRRDLLHRTVRRTLLKTAFLTQPTVICLPSVSHPFSPFGQPPEQHGCRMPCPTGKGGFYAVSLQ